jgi:beta-phosphoglucomutase-like phosphatase (HAD superfamily)
MRDEASVGIEALGLDPGVRACLFDLDGVLIQTARLHAEAWKETFDTFLRAYRLHAMSRQEPFDDPAAYEMHLDGRTGMDGIRAFLGSRGIELPEGSVEDQPGTETVHGINAALPRSHGATVVVKDLGALMNSARGPLPEQAFR